MKTVKGSSRRLTAREKTAQQSVVGILQTADELSRRFAAVIEPHGITLQQFNVLRILRGAGEPLPTMEIGARMIQKAPGITRLLDRLEKKGLIERVRGTDDRRQVFCAIRSAGLALLRQLDAPVAALDERCVAPLGMGQRERLIQLLASVRKGLPGG